MGGGRLGTGCLPRRKGCRLLLAALPEVVAQEAVLLSGVLPFSLAVIPSSTQGGLRGAEEQRTPSKQ